MAIDITPISKAIEGVMKLLEFTPEFFEESLPQRSEMTEGVLYISIKYAGAGHLCFCGCGQHIFVGLKESDLLEFGWSDGWGLIIESEDKGVVSLTPSMLHFNGCKSHYILTKNKINWC